MPEVGSASLAIIPSFKGFQNDLESGTSKHMAAAGATGGEKFGDSAGKAAGSKFKSHIKSAAKIAAVGLGLAGAAAFKFAGDAVEEAREAQKVGALTESTIRATGKAAKVTAKHVGDLSGKISEKVGIDDEAIQSGANMLLTFKNIRNEAGEGNKIFDQTLTTLVDMSSAMGTDAKTSAIQLGKALNDPIKGVSALSRVGVTFTDQQKNQIKALVEAGNVMGAQKIVLRELKSEFGGAAKAQATEADKLTVAWGNFKEEIGTQLLPVMDDLAIFLRKKGIPAARDFAGWVRDDAVPALKDAAKFAGNLASNARDLAGWLNKFPKSTKIAAIAAALGTGAALKMRGGNRLGGGGGVLGAVGRATGLAKPIPVFVTNQGFGGGAGGGGLFGGGKGAPAPATKLGKVASAASKAVLPVSVVAWSAVALKGFWDWNHSKDKGKPLAYMNGGKVGQAARDFFAPSDVERLKEAEAAYKGINDASEKLPNKFELGMNAGQRLADQVFRLDQGIKKVEGRKNVDIQAPNLLTLLNQAREYGSILAGLDNRTITTIMKTRYERNDTTSSVQPPNRSGFVGATGGIVTRPTRALIGEAGPEAVVPLNRAPGASPLPEGGGRIILEIDGEQFDARVRRVADDRYNANRHHPTGRRR